MRFQDDLKGLREKGDERAKEWRRNVKKRGKEKKLGNSGYKRRGT